MEEAGDGGTRRRPSAARCAAVEGNWRSRARVGSGVEVEERRRGDVEVRG